MTTDRDIRDQPETAPDAVVDAPRMQPPTDQVAATAGASQPHDEAAMRAREGFGLVRLRAGRRPEGEGGRRPARETPVPFPSSA